MGERGIDHAEAPTDDELERMGQLAAEAIAAGAVGFLTSRSCDARLVRRTSDPDAHGRRARAPRGCARDRRHRRRDVRAGVRDGEIDDHLRVARRMCEVSGRPLSRSPSSGRVAPCDEYRAILAAIEDAEAAGLAMWGQVAPSGWTAHLPRESPQPAGRRALLGGVPRCPRVEALRSGSHPDLTRVHSAGGGDGRREGHKDERQAGGRQCPATREASSHRCSTRAACAGQRSGLRDQDRDREQPRRRRFDCV